MKKRLLCALLALSLLTLPGCKRDPEPVEFSTFAMDTMMSFTLYGDKEKCAIARSTIGMILSDYEAALSATREDGGIAKVNRADGQPVELGSPQLLERTLELCEVTGGALDITAYPAVKAWGFTQEEHQVPSPAELAELVEKIDYTAIKLEGDTVTLPAGVEIDLGAVAKGYVGDVLAGQIGLTSALLDLGQSTIVAVGSKPQGTPWRIGVVDPTRPGSYFAVVELEDCAMGTSGGYQRYFEQDGITYWHILDPDTAAPARSGLASVTVVSPSALTCDGLSTALFVMGLEDGAQFWRDHPELDFEAVFVTETGEIYRTAGLEGRFSLAEGYEDREVKVLE
jgi:thiamine biosynthesis lipoprotein